ncbi:MAG: hypothetical protein A2086_09145 [Spirochaetes bacterium GWD1_27_9]|nr:MAG: hypothetical protein A2Z98_12960 [Spirochaetes bacterium GWB1_27_13]OHD31978.1 MAG: hypothetical protein A2086_09145 [Spirochaetes bacterium GWD1_27_9]
MQLFNNVQDILFKSDRKEIDIHLKKEEYKAERIISIFRVVLYMGCFLEIIFVTFLDIHAVISKLFIPMLSILLFAIVQMIDIWFIGKKQFQKYFTHYVKYFVTIIDTIVACLFIYQIVHIMGDNNSYIWMFCLMFGLVSSLLLIISIFRYSLFATLFNGILLISTFIIMYSLFIPGGSITTILFNNGQYNIKTAITLWSILTFTPLCAILSGNIRRMLLINKRQERLSRFLPESIASDIISGKSKIELGGTKRTVTILFSDIRNFTALSENWEPEKVINLLNLYYENMIQSVFEHHGILDKLMGDGIMAIFDSAVSSVDNHAENSVQCALNMIERLTVINEEIGYLGIAPLRIGIGIHTGDAVLGYLGSNKRMDYTAIGDTVNTASRLENLTKKFNVPLIISRQTQELIDPSLQTKDLGTTEIRGKTKLLNICTVQYPDRQKTS